jgi:hypothetical protein
MTIKIHRILKDGLSKEDTLNVVSSGLNETSGMTISHLAYSLKQTEATIPYEIDIVEENVPEISDVDFCVVVRTKVDLTAVGVNQDTIEDVGSDIGEYNYTASVPSRLSDLPPGFTELYKG